MPVAPSPAQQDASRAALNGTRHGLCGGEFDLMPSEDAQELDLLRQAVAADWRPRDAYERHWASELVAAMWRQQRLRGLELAALAAADVKDVVSEASLRRLLTFARYGARLDGDLGRALKALRSLKGRTQDDLATTTVAEPLPAQDDATSLLVRTPEPERTAAPALAAPIRAAAPVTPPVPNRHERRRHEALAREARRRAA